MQSSENASVVILQDLKDPSLEKYGCNTPTDVIFDEETPLKFQDEKQEIVPDAPFHFRIITYGDKQEKFERVRFEVTMEGNLFFFYYCEFDQESYKMFKEDTGISCDLQDFPKKIIEYMNYNLQKDENYSVVLSQVDETRCILGFKQKLAIKEVELVSLDLDPETDEFVNEQIQYRFDKARANLKKARNEKDDLCKLMNVSDSSSLLKVSAKGKVPSASPRTPK